MLAAVDSMAVEADSTVVVAVSTAVAAGAKRP
jgi:hypothetical protein